MSLFEELKRRNVIRVSVAYLVAAWVLLQIADLVLENISAPDWVIQSIMLVMAIGFPLVVILAWALEVTPQGIMLEKNVDRTQSITSQTGRKLDFAIIGILAVLVVYLLVDKLVLHDELQTPGETVLITETAEIIDKGPSVAVLPFVNMSDDKNNEYFSDGLTETLLHMLSQLPELRVAARTSSFAFKGRNTRVADIAAALGVGHILEGSVQKADERVRITAQLIRADDGFHVWSQSYTRPLEDIFAIQDEIAGVVAEALGSSLLGTAPHDMHGVSTTDLAAYDSYLKGLEQQAIFSYGSLDNAENHFRQALARDPNFTDARLSLVQNIQLKYDTGLITKDQARELTRPMINRVRELEPENTLARALELTLEITIFEDIRSAEETGAMAEELRGLLQIIPTESKIRIELAQSLYFYFLKKQEALDVLQAGLMIDPLAADLHRELGRILANENHYDQARSALLRSIELAPDNPNSYGVLTELEKKANNLPGALEWMRKAAAIDPRDHELASMIAHDLFALRLTEEADRWFDRVQALAPESAVSRNLEVQRAVAMDEPEKAIQLAAAAIEDQISMRRGAFDQSLFTYVDLMMKVGRAREAFDFLLSVRPDVINFDQFTPDVQGSDMKWAALALMSDFETFDQRKASWNQYTDQMKATNPPWLRDPESEYQVWDLLMNGETEKAVEQYLEFELTKPLAENLLRHTRSLYSVFAPVYEDPRVAAKLQEESQRYEQLRKEISGMLERPEWQ